MIVSIDALKPLIEAMLEVTLTFSSFHKLWLDGNLSTCKARRERLKFIGDMRLIRINLFELCKSQLISATLRLLLAKHACIAMQFCTECTLVAVQQRLAI